MFSKNLRGALEIGEITPKVYRWGKALRRLHTCTELCSHLGNHIMINHAILFLHWIISKWPTCCDSHFFPTKILVVFPLKGNNWELMQKNITYLTWHWDYIFSPRIFLPETANYTAPSPSSWFENISVEWIGPWGSFIGSWRYRMNWFHGRQSPGASASKEGRGPR